MTFRRFALIKSGLARFDWALSTYERGRFIYAITGAIKSEIKSEIKTECIGFGCNRNIRTIQFEHKSVLNQTFYYFTSIRECNSCQTWQRKGQMWVHKLAPKSWRSTSFTENVPIWKHTSRGSGRSFWIFIGTKIASSDWPRPPLFNIF